MGRYTGYTWVYSPKADRITERMRKEIEDKSRPIIERLKKEYVKKLPKKLDCNYIVDIYSKWIQRRFYLCSKYICPKDAIFPWFENKFARLEYTGKKINNNNNKFQLFFMRHTGEWIKVLEDKSLNMCLKEIETSPWFVPW
ncbi:MAG: hypothetical protein AABX96_00665 [Nanoarchaeota archaeon]